MVSRNTQQKKDFTCRYLPIFCGFPPDIVLEHPIMIQMPTAINGNTIIKTETHWENTKYHRSTGIHYHGFNSCQLKWCVTITLWNYKTDRQIQHFATCFALQHILTIYTQHIAEQYELRVLLYYSVIPCIVLVVLKFSCWGSAQGLESF